LGELHWFAEKNRILQSQNRTIVKAQAWNPTCLVNAFSYRDMAGFSLESPPQLIRPAFGREWAGTSNKNEIRKNS
jgi:hypothetical protein